MTRARSPSASSSLNITTSPTCSKSSAATTLRASLSMTSWPRWQRRRGRRDGLTLTRSLRPPVNTSMESSSLRARKVPKPAGGWASRSTSSLSVMIWSRASRRVWARRSFCEVTAGQRALGVGEPLLEAAGVRRARRPAGGAGRSPRPRGSRTWLAQLVGARPVRAGPLRGVMTSPHASGPPVSSTLPVARWTVARADPHACRHDLIATLERVRRSQPRSPGQSVGGSSATCGGSPAGRGPS